MRLESPRKEFEVREKGRRITKKKNSNFSEKVDTCTLSNALKAFLSKEDLDSCYFEHFYDSVQKEFSAKEMTLFMVCLVHQKVQSPSQKEKGLFHYEEGKDFVNLIEELKRKLANFGRFDELGQFMGELKENKEFWKYNWEHLKFKRRKNKDYFKIYLPKLINQISGDKDVEEELKLFFHERNNGKCTS
jgi:hypothetical protein